MGLSELIDTLQIEFGHAQKYRQKRRAKSCKFNIKYEQQATKRIKFKYPAGARR